jgi:hypothetical protein
MPATQKKTGLNDLLLALLPGSQLYEDLISTGG